MTTLGDLLRQDGALALLAIGAVLGFFAGRIFQSPKGNSESAPAGSALAAARAAGSDSPARGAAPAQGVPQAVFAAISAAVYQHRNENS
ncbi:MAG: hypothetical protein FWC65_02355 [Treponema sp.]|nr:hypothetical protein [Treponema sp.]